MGALLVEPVVPLGGTAFLERRRIPAGFVFWWQWHREHPGREFSFGRSWSVPQVMKICFPVMSVPDSQKRKDCLTELHLVSDIFGWADSKVLLLLSI